MVFYLTRKNGYVLLSRRPTSGLLGGMRQRADERRSARSSGVPTSAELAAQVQPAMQGDAQAQFNLGSIYGSGSENKRNYKKAFKWYRLAAKQGLPQAQFNLSIMYRKGWGVLKDYVEAYKWANLSSANGHKNGAKLREYIEGQMTPTQIEKSQHLSRQCVDKNYVGC